MLILTCLATTAASRVQAQTAGTGTLTGQVVDSTNGHPLEGVYVFIGGSTVGTVTDAAGLYRLTGVPPGADKLYVSMLGYEVVQKDLRFRGGDTLKVSLRLKPVIVQLSEAVMSERESRRWHKYLDTFTRMFVGESPNAAETEIENPEVLDFEARRGRLTARASAPLVIVNKALGYRIKYFLKEFFTRGSNIYFNGQPLFEPLEPTDSAEAARWAEKRREAFYGSFRHFMSAVLADSAESAGFLTYVRPGSDRTHLGRDRFSLPASSLVKQRAGSSDSVLDFAGAVEVIYLNEHEAESYPDWLDADRNPDRVQTSWLFLPGGKPAIVDFTGELLDPYAVTVAGYFAFERIADELPKEYRPE